MPRFGWFAWMLAVAACGRTAGPDPEEGGRVIATVNDVPITEAQLRAHIAQMGRSGKARARTRAGRRAILDSMIRAEVLWQEANRRNLRADRVVRDQFDPGLVKRLLAKEFEPTVTIDQVDPREVERIYRERWDEFHRPGAWRLGVIKAKNRAAAGQIVNRLRQSAFDPDFFEEIAGGPDNVDERLRAHHGEIGYTTLENIRSVLPPYLLPAFEEIQTTLMLPKVVEVPEGIYVMIMTGQQPEIDRTLDEMRGGLRQQAFRELRDRRLEELVASFRKKHDVAVHYELLDLLPATEPQSHPASPARTVRAADGGAGDGGATGGP